MNERVIFSAAVGIADRAERQAFIDAQCGGDAELRSRIQSLLAAHELSGEFLAIPALEQLSPEAAAGQTQCESEAEQLRAAETEDEFSFLAPSTRPGSLGRLGNYEIEETLGRGGFGVVYRAFDEMLHRTVAIKVMSAQFAATSPARKRFLREARSAAGVRHRNVVGIYSVGEDPVPHLVMEYIDGPTLQERLDQAGPFDAFAVAEIGRQIASGLAAAHSLGLVHRDIKPANILLENGADQIRITDFGLARLVDDASMTRSGQIAGTPLYMSPEQARGESVDHRSDLFSLGSVMYVMCSGRPPFRAESAFAVLRRVAEDEARPIREIIPEAPEWLTSIISKLLSKRPEDRFASAQEVADLLQRNLTEVQQRGAPTPPPESPGRSKSRPRRPGLVAAAMAAAVVCALGFTEGTGLTDFRGTVVRFISPDGVLVVEVDDPQVSLSINGDDLSITGAGAKEIRLRAGKHDLLATRAGKVIQREVLTIQRNGRLVVRIRNEGAEGPVDGAPPAGSAADPDRVAAVRLREVPCRLRVRLHDGKEVDVDPDKPLPEGQFVVVEVAAASTSPVDEPARNKFISAIGNLCHLQVVSDFSGHMHWSDDDLAAIASGCRAKHIRSIIGDFELSPTTGRVLKQIPGLNVLQCTVQDRNSALSLSGMLLDDLGLHAPGWWAGWSDRPTVRLSPEAWEVVLKMDLADFLLSGVEINDEVTEDIASMKRLHSLRLSYVPAARQSLRRFSQIPTLRQLSWTDDLSDSDLPGLSAFTQLTMLRLIEGRRGRLSQQAVEKLASSLPACTIEWKGGRIEPKNRRPRAK